MQIRVSKRAFTASIERISIDSLYTRGKGDVFRHTFDDKAVGGKVRYKHRLLHVRASAILVDTRSSSAEVSAGRVRDRFPHIIMRAITQEWWYVSSLRRTVLRLRRNDLG